jgi:integrase
MSQTLNILTATEVKSFKPSDKVKRYSDGGGLFLTVQPNGSKLWHFRYKIDGKGQMASLGKYDDVTLAKARKKAQRIREDLADGITPKDRARMDEKEAAKERLQWDSTFESVARTWFKEQCALEGDNQAWTNDKHQAQVITTLETYVFPKLGDMPIADVTAKHIRKVIDALKNQGKWETGQRVFQRISMVIDAAIEEGIIENSPCDFLRRQKLFKNRPAKGHFAALEPAKLGDLMEAIDKADLNPMTEHAIRLSLMTVVRPGELRAMEWSEIDMESRQWVIPAAKTKRKRDHIVPLTDDMIEILHKLESLSGRNRYVFPHRSKGHEPMSQGTVNMSLKRMGFGGICTAHGFRAVFSTHANEVGVYRREVIELQLAHWVGSETELAYNRALYLDDRAKLMQDWCQFITEASIPKVTAISSRRKKS